MLTYRSETFAEAYRKSLIDLFTFPEYVTRPRDMEIKENCDVALVIEDPLSCLYENPVRSSQFKYISAELLWYFMGRNDVEYISKFAKFWESIQNEDGTVNSAYGHLLFSTPNEHGFTQYHWAFESLRKDKDSRQAVMHFNLPIHLYPPYIITRHQLLQPYLRRYHRTHQRCAPFSGQVPSRLPQPSHL